MAVTGLLECGMHDFKNVSKAERIFQRELYWHSVCQWSQCSPNLFVLLTQIECKRNHGLCLPGELLTHDQPGREQDSCEIVSMLIDELQKFLSPVWREKLPRGQRGKGGRIHLHASPWYQECRLRRHLERSPILLLLSALLRCKQFMTPLGKIGVLRGFRKFWLPLPAPLVELVSADYLLPDRFE